ncbi:MAG: hypothetical protein B6241_04425 [Spirochaetaceae bacterium 4572_59]|nr:MAG: hypothetical protein B6241_04425 [Spirochaetaceae bacterium 4572_59]
MTGIILAVAIIVMAGGFLYLKNRIERAITSDEWISRIRDEIDELVLEMNQTAERNVALLENRINTLEILLENADKKMLIMQKESEKSDLSRQVYSHLKKSAVIPSEEEPPSQTYPHSQGLQLSLEEEEKKLEQEKPLTLKNSVMSLYGQGFSADIISQKLQASIAEVDLIISLHREGAE